MNESITNLVNIEKKNGLTSKSKNHLKSFVGERSKWKEVKTVEVVGQESSEFENEKKKDGKENG